MLTAMSSLLDRRALLRAAGAGLPAGVLVAVSGCRAQTPPPAPDPDRVALQRALAVEEQLAVAVAGLPPDRHPSLTDTAVEVVDTHVQVLTSALGTTSPSASPAASPSAGSSPSSTGLDDVLTAAGAAADSHTFELRRASASISPLLASLAASDAALAALVRGAR